MAQISRRGTGQWRARVRRKGYPDLSKTFDIRADAEKWARMVERDMDRGSYVPSPESERVTLAEALERFTREYIEPRLAHPRKEVTRAQRLGSRDLARKTLAAIRGGDLAKFIQEREAEGAGGNTIRLELAVLSRLYSWARAAWGMEGLANPVQNVIRPKLPSGRTRRLEEGEEEKLLAACVNRFRPVVLFALETAMRREEISTLTWEQVDLKNRSLHLPRTKNGEPRSVPLSPAALDLLKALPRQISGSVFGYRTDSISYAFRRACAKAGLENLHFHDLRHEATSRLFENTDLDVMEIKGITGHKSLAMLVRYSHLRAHRLADRLAGKQRG